MVSHFKVLKKQVRLGLPICRDRKGLSNTFQTWKESWTSRECSNPESVFISFQSLRAGLSDSLPCLWIANCFLVFHIH